MMPFWTIFWVAVPPILLMALAVLFYIRTGKEDE